jgi:type IV secretion system protein VirB6
LDELVHPPALPALPPAGPGAVAGAASPAVAPITPSDLPIEARSAVASADHLLVVAVLAGTLSVRVVLALLLALGPLFIACFLFSGTRGLFVGWVRVLAGAALAAVAVPMVIALELAVIEPQVLALRSLLDASQPLGTLPGEMLATCSFFALVMLAALIALARTASAFRLPDAVQREARRVFAPGAVPALAANQRGQAASLTGAGAPAGPGARGRAQQIADAARAMERRETQVQAGGTAVVRDVRPRDTSPQRQDMVAPPVPLGQAGRRSGSRLSAAAGRRDQG